MQAPTVCNCGSARGTRRAAQADSREGSSNAPLQRRHQGSGEGRPSGGVPLALFPDSQEGRRSSAGLGLKRLKSVPATPPVQNAHGSKSTTGHKSRRLVCHGRPQGRLFPNTDLERALALPSVPIRGQNIRVHGPSVWDLSGTSYVHEVYGRSSRTPSSARPQGPQLFRRLAGMCPVRTDVPRPHFQVAAAHQRVGAAQQRKEEQTGTIAGHSVPWHDPGLQGSINLPNRTAERGHKGLPPPLSPQRKGELEVVSPSDGPDGSHGPDSPTQPFTHAAGAAVSAEVGLRPTDFHVDQSLGDTTTLCGPSLVEAPTEFAKGQQAGPRDTSTTPGNGCLTGRLGGCACWPRGPGCLVQQTVDSTHQCPRAPGDSRCAHAIPPTPSGPSCTCQDRQYSGSSLCQQAGRAGLSPLRAAGPRAVDMGLSEVSLSESHLPARSSEHSGRLVVQGGPSARRVEAPSGGCCADLAPLRDGRGRPVRLQGDNSLPDVLLPWEGQPTTGDGCSSSPVASRPAVRLSPFHPSPPAAVEDPVRESGGDLGGPELASHAMVLRDRTTLERDSLGAPCAERPVAAGTRHLVSSLPTGPEAVGMAPDRAEFRALGFSEPVIQTLESARAPSTRAAYAFRWGMFTSWCEVHRVHPLVSTAQHILQFLQEQLAQGKSAATLRGMVAAIKASRVGNWSLSERCCTLISQFLKGAQRQTVRPKTPMVPPWDLDRVLGALQHAPFEPIETVELKWLSLKTALLLAVCSARRIGELHALSVHRECCRLLPGNAGVVLRPNPAFLPKVLSDANRNQTIELSPLPPTLEEDGTGYRASALCPVRALLCYMERTSSVRKTDQLFVCFKTERLGEPLSKSRLSRWVVEAIRQAYTDTEGPTLPGLRAHSTRGMATSWALWRGASLQEICKAATWSTASTFAKYYSLNIAASPSFGERVLAATRP